MLAPVTPTWEVYGCLGAAVERGMAWAVPILLTYVAECDLALLASRARQRGHPHVANLIRLP